MSVQVAPSVLSADFGKLAEEVEMAADAGAELLHLDVMDGHFVPNITFGPMIVKAIRNLTDLSLDTHLMIKDPDKYLDNFIDAGADTLYSHLEAFDSSDRHERMTAIIDRLEATEVACGIAVNPDTPADWIYPYLGKLENVLIMTVYPGFGGQKLIVECLDKIALLKKEAGRLGSEITIGVDGGVNLDTAKLVVDAGADILVAGSAVFNAPEPSRVISQLRNI